MPRPPELGRVPADDDGSDPATAAQRRVASAHADTLATVRECAEATAATWDGERTADRAAVVRPFEAALERSGALDRLPAVLSTAVAATGRELQADPVPAPPYVAITSVGPVLRATLPDGRLVVTLRTFAVEREPQPRYALAPELSVTAEFRD